MFSQQWWVGVGVVLAAAAALVSILVASGGSSGGTTQVNNVQGQCNAVGTNNTANCSTPSTEPSR